MKDTFVILRWDLIPKAGADFRTCLYLFVEVEESFGTVDVVKGREGLDGAVYCHGVEPHRPTRGHQHPVRRRPADKHLKKPAVPTFL